VFFAASGFISLIYIKNYEELSVVYKIITQIIILIKTIVAFAFSLVCLYSLSEGVVYSEASVILVISGFFLLYGLLRRAQGN